MTGDACNDSSIQALIACYVRDSEARHRSKGAGIRGNLPAPLGTHRGLRKSYEISFYGEQIMSPVEGFNLDG